MVAARSNPHLDSFRDKLVAAGKSKLVALIAVACKLTTILNASFEIDAHGSQSRLSNKTVVPYFTLPNLSHGC